MKTIESSISNRVGTIVLNRPEKRNAISDEMVGELKSVLEDWKSNPGVKVVIIKAKGKAFCAGADLAYLQKLQNLSFRENLEDSLSLMRLYREIYTYPKIVIAAVQGAAIAGGCGLASVCDLIYASPNAKFGYSEVKIGFIPAIVSWFLLKKLSQSHSRALMLTGKVLGAVEAKSIGMIHEICEEEPVYEFAIKQAEDLVVNTSAKAVEETKKLLNELEDLDMEEALINAATANASMREEKDCKEGIRAFLNKEELKW